jgi:hypothetical protein
VRTAQHCKQPAKVVGKQSDKELFSSVAKSKMNADFLDSERDKSKGGMCPGLPPYDEFLGFSGRVGGHSDNQKKEQWIWACMCFIIIECLGQLKVLAVAATISKLTLVFLSLFLFHGLPLSGRASDCAHIWIIMNRGQKKTWYSFQKDLLPES